MILPLSLRFIRILGDPHADIPESHLRVNDIRLS